MRLNPVYADCDFHGWATRYNVKCTDGRTIRNGAFADQDGKKIPLIWAHQHDSPDSVLGHGFLESWPEGMYFYGYINDDMPMSPSARSGIDHGDIDSLSIWANHLTQGRSGEVYHGTIKEVSLCLGGANNEAIIQHPLIAHSDDEDDFRLDETEAYIFTYQGDADRICHGDFEGGSTMDENKSVGDVLDGMTPEQQAVVTYAAEQGYMAGYDAALADDEDDDDELDEDLDDEEDDEDYDDEDDEDGDDLAHDDMEEYGMKFNAFATGAAAPSYISHEDQEAILDYAKNGGQRTWKDAYFGYLNDNELSHDDVAATSGFNSYAEGGVDVLFPEYRDIRPGAPELVTNDQTWVNHVMAKVHKTPYSRIRTRQVDIRNIDALRAKGYDKGKKKTLSGNYSLARRSTDPQTVFVRSSLNRDDITDIVDFDYIAYQYNVDKIQLNEEVATAILIGDGRAEEDENKIKEEHIRPIWNDDELYTIHKDFAFASAKASLQGTETGNHFGDSYIYAEGMIETVLYAREKFKGSGTPDMYCTPNMLNKMLLARDLNGRRVYANKQELATALNVGEIHTVEQFEGRTRTAGTGVNAKTKKLLALIVNLADYNVGSTKGGELTHFTQFDIDFNQEKSLLETRLSGALTRCWSAIAIEEDVTAASSEP